MRRCPVVAGVTGLELGKEFRADQEAVQLTGMPETKKTANWFSQSGHVE